MADLPFDIDVLRQAGEWPDLNAEVIIQAALSVLNRPRHGELSIVLSDDAHVQNLNQKYRHKDKPTNVLSFPQDGPLLGDIVLAHETITQEAAHKAIDLEDHAAHLLIHGFLHLQGYDHEIDTAAQKMEALEIRALAVLGIDNPYTIKDV